MPGGDLRIGVDLVEIRQIGRLLRTDLGVRVVSRLFTSGERSDSNSAAAGLAARWAVKESVVKAIGCGFGAIRPMDIEVRVDDNGRPRVAAVARKPWPHDAHLWSWSVSMTHECGLALAVAIAAPVTADHGSTGT